MKFQSIQRLMNFTKLFFVILFQCILQASSFEDLSQLKIMEPGHTMVLRASLGEETIVFGLILN